MSEPERPLFPGGRAYDHEQTPPGAQPVPFDVEGDEETWWDEEPDSPARHPRGRSCLAAAIVFLLLAGSIGAIAWYFGYKQVFPGGAQGEEVNVEVPAGVGASRVADLLEMKGVVPSALGFRAYVRFRARDLEVQTGEYVFRKNSSVPQALDVLRRGPRPAETHRFTVPEGLTIEGMAPVVGSVPGLSAEEFLAVVRSGRHRWDEQPSDITTLEGLLFPDTYEVFREEFDEDRAVAGLLDRFGQVWASLDRSRSAELGLTPYQTVVVASLIEEEAKVPEDRELISSVIYNRLREGMPLQIDATILYVIGHKETVLFSDLEVDSPYNTYKNTGLPPTPISAPGRDSLQAALDPAATDYLYYVLCEARGKHCFANDIDEFNRLKAKAEEDGLL